MPITPNDLLGELKKLRPGQLQHIAVAIQALQRQIFTAPNKASDFATPELVADLGDLLCLHHAFSNGPLGKDKFEHALERILNAHGRQATLAPRGNPGHDLTVDGVAWSLKSQADKGIRRDSIHISKFMELGKGKWDALQDLAGLRDQMLAHMQTYQRIFTLRRMNGQRSKESGHFYELVEIPKSLLQESERGRLEIRTDGKQTPKPGYCTVYDKTGAVKFQPYFDGGTERKLQIKRLKKSFCTVHATWDLV